MSSRRNTDVARGVLFCHASSVGKPGWTLPPNRWRVVANALFFPGATNPAPPRRW